MAHLTSLPLEILHQIFHNLQSSTSGPRYAYSPFCPGNDSDFPVRLKSFPPHRCWQLTDPGALYLAATCRQFQSIYLSPTIPGNLILELSLPWHGKEDDYFALWGLKAQFLERSLNRMKTARKGRPLERFILDSKWNHAWDSRLGLVWRETCQSVAKIFGRELKLVILYQGDRVVEDIAMHSPRKIRELEEMGRSLNNHSPLPMDIAESVPSIVPPATCPKVSYNLRGKTRKTNSPDLKATANERPIRPLSLHIYFSHDQGAAESLAEGVLAAFSAYGLRSIYFSSDPNNLEIHDWSNWPSSRLLRQPRNSVAEAGMWHSLLQSHSRACDTLEEITLDCAIFWSYLAAVLPDLHRLRKLDAELALLRSEDARYKLLDKTAAGSRILSTCLTDNAIVQEKESSPEREKVARH